MNKKLSSIAAMLILSIAAAAQDTIDLLGPKSNYFDNPYWYLNSGDTVDVSGMDGCVAYGYSAADSLTVYGIAASIICHHENPTNVEFLKLYEWPDSLIDTVLQVNYRYNISQMGENLMVNLAEPPTYYMRQDLVERVGYMQFNKAPVYPVYERYFRKPYRVCNQFFVAIYPSSGHYDGTFVASFSKYPHWRYISMLALHHTEAYYPHPNTYFPEGWYGNHSPWSNGPPFIYPILTPRDTTLPEDTIFNGDTIIVCDTVIINGDTIVTYDTILGIDDHGLLGRLTGVMPNPAAETAKVVSSFGMSRVEVYNMAGERVHDVRVPGGSLSATLDLRRLPAGAYLLRIHTPQGVATKKLTVRR